jgi:hypothetical protein
MSGVGISDRRKADPLVKTCRIRVFSAQAHTAEVGARALDESRHHRSSHAFISPCGPHVNTTDAAHIGTPGKWITIKAALGNQQALVEMAAEDLARSVEAVLRAGPFLHQGFNEAVALGPCLRLQILHARGRQFNFLDRDHRLNDKDNGCLAMRPT